MTVLRIRDVYPRIRLFPSLIPGQKDSGSRIRIKEFTYSRTIVSKLSKIWYGMLIPDPDLDFLPILDQGSKRHRIPDPQHCLKSFLEGWIWILIRIQLIRTRNTGTVGRYLSQWINRCNTKVPVPGTIKWKLWYTNKIPEVYKNVPRVKDHAAIDDATNALFKWGEAFPWCNCRFLWPQPISLAWNRKCNCKPAMLLNGIPYKFKKNNRKTNDPS